MKAYNHKEIENKWIKFWEENSIYKTKEDKNKPKYYILDMFPYPSGQGLHVGHPKGYIATDIFSRFMRMKGKNILHPMGFDAFGLPAENYAIKNKIHPRVAVEKNVQHFKNQLEIIGLDYDWSREINTTDPKYYKWTQWIFLKLFEKGLAFESMEPINWCPSCKTGLANEDLEDGKCERCGSEIEKKPMRQWVLKITEYADRLLKDLDDLDWPESIKELQKNWIGRSQGAEFDFKLENFENEKIKIFTTRADTILGVTHLVVSPEYKEIEKLLTKCQNRAEVEKYIQEASKKTEIERTSEGREKTGIKINEVCAINPFNNQAVPVWVADYVLGDYGTGAVMAVPAHDERDLEFAKKYGISTEDKGLLNKEEAEEKGQKVVKYKLRDWVFSRQRYWGEPIPIIHCEKCGSVPVPESDLPVLLPEVESYEPTGTGDSPLAGIDSWVETKCPKCGGPAKRETNTMPQWAGSSWYYLRYCDPNNDKELISKEEEKYWQPVDFYVGGAEHATRHLIYARFWHKFLQDIGVVNYPEPFIRLQHVGLIYGPDGKKMSKRFGNVVNPDEVIETYGADAFRTYEMFLGPFDQAVAWSTNGIIGTRRFIEKVWALQEKVVKDGESAILDSETETLLHQTIQKIGQDILEFKLNTAISSLMILTNKLSELEKINKKTFETLLQLLAPFAPHICEEIWHILGNSDSIHLSVWPEYDEKKVISSKVKIALQINGKTKNIFEAPAGISEKEAIDIVNSLSSGEKNLMGKKVVKIIFVQDKILNFVVEN